MPIVNVVAKITTKPGMREEVLKIFEQNIPNVLAEDGCIEYGSTIDMEGVGNFQTTLGPDTFVVIEKWESLEHLMAHTVTPHMKTYASKVQNMLDSRAIHVLKST
tara:strand:- start:20 stop:334 length:315 start_codon:yes stop_codon:yes gene_type:complete